MTSWSLQMFLTGSKRFAILSLTFVYGLSDKRTLYKPSSFLNSDCMRSGCLLEEVYEAVLFVYTVSVVTFFFIVGGGFFKRK